jgi:hypothetical protein
MPQVAGMGSMVTSAEEWITCGAWRVNVAKGLAAHDGTGSVFRIIRDPLCAVWIHSDVTPPMAELGTLQAQAVAVFWATERLLARIQRGRLRRLD